MSFILDALRKSEHERQRSAIPGVAQVPFGLPRREMPAWATVLIVVLLVALLGLGGAYWRSARSDGGGEREANVQHDVPLALPSPAATSPALTPSTQRTTPPAFQPPPRTVNAPPTSPAGALAARAPSQESVSPSPASSQPAFAPPPQISTRDSSREPTLPSPAALAAEGVPVPPLKLELHAFATRPADRFVFINGTKYVEGSRLAEGPQLVSIEPDGAVLTYLGHRFLLANQ